MNALIPYLALTQRLSDVLAKTIQQLNGVGLQIEQTFDLQVARLPHIGCQCPHHGTDQCNCQLVVLLVRGKCKAHITLVLHGSDGQTNLSIIDHSGKQENNDLSKLVRQELTPADTERA